MNKMAVRGSERGGVTVEYVLVMLLAFILLAGGYPDGPVFNGVNELMRRMADDILHGMGRVIGSYWP